MDKKYDHQKIAKQYLTRWNCDSFFQAPRKIENKKTFSIIMPPPNVTGKLHLGHAWDGTIQDLLARYKRSCGYDVLYLPGMDHAGIATQTKVEQRIQEELGKKLKEISKTQFLEYAWAWKEQYSAEIAHQWSQMGLSPDYSLQYFTLDETLNTKVREVFVTLFNEGLIYQGNKIINWDPVLQTALSNIEVNYELVQGKMYYLKYYYNQEQYVTVATTRPETMFGDVCLVANPNDNRFNHLKNTKVINPCNQKEIPIIFDSHVDINFGTGIMKCTPAHDFIDFEIAQTHQLATPICMTLEAKMNDLCFEFVGMDRFECRKKLIAKLTKQNMVVKIDDYTHQVGHSQRSNAIIEPYLSKQWFVKMESLSQRVITAQHSTNKTLFTPEYFEEHLLHWLNNMQDWCISRQLWWGHQIPVWYHKTTKEMYVDTNPPTDLENYEQDPDVLDTWFSSALVPFSTLENDEILYDKYFPTSVLVTAYDIIFFWVARMLMMSYKFTQQKPFDQVLIHGLIRDPLGRKMSKSLNNGIDPMSVIEQFGADALRYFLVSNCAPGQDLRYDEIKVGAAWNFMNKIWNAARFVVLNLPENFNFKQEEFFSSMNKNQGDKIIYAINSWILVELDLVCAKIEANMEKYEFNLVANELSKFIWEKYCDWYIFLVKDHQQDLSIQNTLYYVLLQIIILIHPFAPFISQAIYEEMGYEKNLNAQSFPNLKAFINQDHREAGELFHIIESIIKAARELRTEEKWNNKYVINYHLVEEEGPSLLKNHQVLLNEYLVKMNIKINTISNSPLTCSTKKTQFVGTLLLETELYEDKNKKQAQIIKIKAELEKLDCEIARAQNMLNNQSFLQKAPAAKVAIEQQKLTAYQEQKNIFLLELKKLT